jgi:HisJ family histidinol phosphate phosphatase
MGPIKSILEQVPEIARMDMHLHSTFSDGRLSPREIVETAIERGLHYIAITDHYLNLKASKTVKIELMEKYISTLKELKEEYKKDIQLNVGLEVYTKGNYSPLPYDIMNQLDILLLESVLLMPNLRLMICQWNVIKFSAKLVLRIEYSTILTQILK